VELQAASAMIITVKASADRPMGKILLRLFTVSPRV
jgi:hypothetical protein